MLTVMSLFSGIGGLDLAAEWAGMQTVMFCEKDHFCQQILKQHWPNVPVVEDVRNVRGMPVDVVTGGYPCQPFSVAGSRKGNGDDRYLWPEMLRVVRECRPTWVVGENVKGHITLGLDTVCDDLEAAGYAVQPYCIPACATGANHERERIFVVAYSASNGRDDGTKSSRDGQTDERSEEGQKQDCNHEGCGSLRLELEWQGREAWGWGTEPPPLRVDAGLPFRMDRNKALGNSVRPQQVYPIFAAIKAISERMT